MRSLKHLGFEGSFSLRDLFLDDSSSTALQIVDLNPVSQLTQLQEFSLFCVHHTLDYSCSSTLTSLTHLSLWAPADKPAHLAHQQQVEFEAQQCQGLGAALSRMHGLGRLELPSLPTGAVAEALSSLTALTFLELHMEEERHGEHVWEQYITGQPRVLPSLKTIVFEKKPSQTDQLLRFLAGTHMPNLVEVAQDGGTIRPSSSTPWWKTALVRAATGALRKCSSIDLNLMDMSVDTAEEAAIAFLSNWRVEDSLIDRCYLDLGSMMSCTRTALSHLPKGLVYLRLWWVWQCI
jgi:hypothetical protein